MPPLQSRFRGTLKYRLIVGIASAPTLRNTHGLKYELLLNGDALEWTIMDGLRPGKSDKSDIFDCPRIVGQLTPPATTHVDVRSGVRSGICPGVALWATIPATALTANNVLEMRLSARVGSQVCGATKTNANRVVATVSTSIWRSTVVSPGA